ncbi:hypothetical protein P8452_62636 [Trifolium repens]|nr:hypothetical protein P8452_62636 [Trifolium repens]
MILFIKSASQKVSNNLACPSSPESVEIITHGFEEKGISFNSQGSQIRVTKTSIFGLMKGSDPYDKMIKIMAVLDALKS